MSFVLLTESHLQFILLEPTNLTDYLARTVKIMNKKCSILFNYCHKCKIQNYILLIVVEELHFVYMTLSTVK